jgi:hypothetical protein
MPAPLVGPQPKRVKTVNAHAPPAATQTQVIDKGGFAVQFGTAPTKDEARALVVKIVAKFGTFLRGRRPNFEVGTVGEKTVYRVRFAGVDKETAAAICGDIRAFGGNCFVARH